jgi:hypothetical protein
MTVGSGTGERMTAEPNLVLAGSCKQRLHGMLTTEVDLSEPFNLCTLISALRHELSWLHCQQPAYNLPLRVRSLFVQSSVLHFGKTVELCPAGPALTAHCLFVSLNQTLTLILGEISVFDGGDYEDGCLLGCCVLQSGRSLPTFQRCMLPTSWGWTASDFYQITRRCVPKYTHLLL